MIIPGCIFEGAFVSIRVKITTRYFLLNFGYPFVEDTEMMIINVPHKINKYYVCLFFNPPFIAFPFSNPAMFYSCSLSLCLTVPIVPSFPLSLCLTVSIVPSCLYLYLSNYAFNPFSYLPLPLFLNVSFPLVLSAVTSPLSHLFNYIFSLPLEFAM